MKKSYNFLSKLPFIRLDNNEVKVIKEAIKICDEGRKLALEKSNEYELFEKQERDFSWARMYLDSVLAKSRIYYYKKRLRGIENFSRYMRIVKGLETREDYIISKRLWERSLSNNKKQRNKLRR